MTGTFPLCTFCAPDRSNQGRTACKIPSLTRPNCQTTSSRSKQERKLRRATIIYGIQEADSRYRVEPSSILFSSTKENREVVSSCHGLTTSFLCAIVHSISSSGQGVYVIRNVPAYSAIGRNVSSQTAMPNTATFI